MALRFPGARVASPSVVGSRVSAGAFRAASWVVLVHRVLRWCGQAEPNARRPQAPTLAFAARPYI